MTIGSEKRLHEVGSGFTTSAYCHESSGSHQRGMHGVEESQWIVVLPRTVISVDWVDCMHFFEYRVGSVETSHSSPLLPATQWSTGMYKYEGKLCSSEAAACRN